MSRRTSRHAGGAARQALASALLCAAVACLLWLGAAARADAAPRAAGLAPPGSPAAAAKQTKLDTILAQVAALAKSRGVQAARQYATPRGVDLRPGGVRVIILATDARVATLQSVRRAVRVAGGIVAGSFDRYVSARVPVTALPRLSRCAAVGSVREPGGCAADATSSEGVAEMNVSPWTAAGFTGAGVKVGIIDGGFKGYQALLGTELPASVSTWGKSALGPEGGPADDVSHGTAVAEIAHDMAPGAQLYLASVGDPVELAEAERWMVQSGVSVINHSMGWWGWGQTDGTGVINQVVDHAVANDVFWANSAGNSRLMHWRGDFTDPDRDFWLDFDNVAGDRYNTFYASAGKYIQACLWWDDSFSAATEDFDLWLAKLNPGTGQWEQVASSERRQGGEAGQTPVEIITYTAPTAGYYAWQVARAWSARTDVDFDLLTPGVTLDNPSNPHAHWFSYERSCCQPADNASAGFMAVAAVERAPGYVQATYSSQGPTRDGRITPEISAPTSVTSVTIPSFTGTSSSSPHIAGLAAILRQAYPTYSAARIETLIKDQAADLGTPGPDTLFGWGRAVLPAVPRDTTRPVTTAWAAKVKRGAGAVLRYRVVDAGFSAGPAKVTLLVKNARGKLVKKLGPFAGRASGVTYRATFRCTLAKGKYRYYVQATDAAGNKAVKIGSAALTVK